MIKENLFYHFIKYISRGDWANVVVLSMLTAIVLFILWGITKWWRRI